MESSNKLARLIWALGVGAGVGAAVLIRGERSLAEAEEQEWMGYAGQNAGPTHYQTEEATGGLAGDDEPTVP